MGVEIWGRKSKFLRGFEPTPGTRRPEPRRIPNRVYVRFRVLGESEPPPRNPTCAEIHGRRTPLASGGVMELASIVRFHTLRAAVSSLMPHDELPRSRMSRLRPVVAPSTRLGSIWVCSLGRTTPVAHLKCLDSLLLRRSLRSASFGDFRLSRSFGLSMIGLRSTAMIRRRRPLLSRASI